MADSPCPSSTADVIKRYEREGTQGTPPPAPIIDEKGHENFLIERIIGMRTKRGRKEYHVKWEGYEETSWEPARNIEKCKGLVAEFLATLPRTRRGSRRGRS
jgi:hypothetical protein